MNKLFPVLLVIVILIVLFFDKLVPNNSMKIDAKPVQVYTLSNGCKKELVYKEIEQLLKNEATYQDLNHYVASCISFDQSNINQDQKNDYFFKTSTFGRILKDTKLHLLKAKHIDEKIVIRLSEYIDQKERTDPFEGLNREQKYLFGSVSQKLGDNYNGIKEDMSRIVDNVQKQNVAIEKYLQDSEKSLNLSTRSYKLSFWATWAALLSLVVAVVQLFDFKFTPKDIWISIKSFLAKNF